MATFELEEATLAAVHKAFKSGELTAKKLVEMYLKRIEAYDRKGPRLNAVITVNPKALEGGRRAGREVQEVRPRGTAPRHPRAAQGQREHKGHADDGRLQEPRRLRPSDGRFITKKLRDAGAIIIAKVNLHEFAVGGESVSSILGQTLNPYDLTRTPGGSSGGSAAAVAAGMVP